MRKFLVCLLLFGCASCTSQEIARKFGGTAGVAVPEGQKVVVATWKEDDLWVLTRPMREGEVPEEYKFQESSSWGIMEGTVVIQESKNGH